jgi:ABC-2 type transport system permease protein
MSRTWAVVKREFTEMIRTKAFVIGTVLGPAFMVGLIALQVLMAKTGAGERTIAIVDATEAGLGSRVSALLAPAPARASGEGEAGAAGSRGDGDVARSRFEVELHPLGDRDREALRAELLARVEAKELDGILWIPSGVAAGEGVLYEGRNATNIAELERVRGAVQVAVQGARLSAAGIDPARVGEALRPIAFDARKVGGRAASGTPMALVMLTYMLGLVVYMVVILYGQAVLRGVLEEKRDRIVEVVASSIRADQLLVGKVVGIGAAGLLQVSIWIAFAAFALTRGELIAARFGGTLPEMPAVPASLGGVFLFFFLAGFFLYASIFSAMGAIATSDQEAQQLQFPVIMLLVVAISMMMPVLNDPSGTIAVVGSIIPFTAPIVMPMRAAITEIPLVELAGSVVIVTLTALGVLWVSAKIYRIGILATGKRPSAAEVWRWIRTA